jgi:hypothetical protein
MKGVNFIESIVFARLTLAISGLFWYYAQGTGHRAQGTTSSVL